MKRAVVYLVLAIFVLLVIQPNLNAGTEPAPVRTPGTTDSVLTNDDVTKQVSQSGALIVIDPAKGGTNAGYDPEGKIAEKDIAMQVAVNIGDALKSAGYQVEYTRWYDDTPTYNTDSEEQQARMETAKSKNPQYILSITFNTGDSLKKGFSVFTQPNSEQLDSLASAIAQEIKVLNYSDFDGIDMDHYANFPLLADPSFPGIMLQLGYLSNSEDYAKISDSQFQDRIGDAVARAFLNTVN